MLALDRLDPFAENRPCTYSASLAVGRVPGRISHLEGNRERQHRLSPRTGEQPRHLTPRSPSGSPVAMDRRGFLYPPAVRASPEGARSPTTRVGNYGPGLWGGS